MSSQISPSTTQTITSPTYTPSQDSIPSILQSQPQSVCSTADPTISNIRSKITASASLNSSLLNTLLSTADAPAALGHKETHLSLLEAELSTHKLALEALQTKATHTLRRHELFRDSIVRRLTYRITAMTAKFQEKAQVAETEYTKALQELSRAQTRLKLLETQLREAEREREELQTQAQKHGEAHKNIDELYESLFAGPTPGFPEEDAREGAHLVARQEYERTSVRLVELRRALRLLFRAGDVIQRAGLSLGHAVRAVDASFFFVLSGVDEEVRAFERYRANTQLLVQKALEISGDPRTAEVGERVLNAIRECVVDLGAVSSKQGLLMSVDHAGKRLNEAAVLLAELKTLTTEKEVTARNNFGWTARMLEDARQALQQIRQEAFEKVVGFGAAPPAYHECCDRASQLQAVGDDDAIDEAHSPLDEIWETSPVDPARESHTPPESLEMSSNLSSTARTPFHSIPVSSTVDMGMLGNPSPKIARG